MSMPRYAAKSDKAREAIVKGLRQCGVVVEDIRLPVDILCWHPRFGRGNFKLLELKTPQKNGKPRKRNDQEAQDAFLAMTGTPVVTDLDGALKALGLIGPVTSVSCTSKPHSVATLLVAAR